VATDEGDRRWGLIAHEDRAAAFGNDQAAYKVQFEGTDWSDYRWEIVDAVLDDPTLAFVSVRFANGTASLPLVLRNANGWSLIGQVSPPHEAIVQVRFTPQGELVGIWAGGG
jgi:hypothetical protein